MTPPVSYTILRQKIVLGSKMPTQPECNILQGSTQPYVKIKVIYINPRYNFLFASKYLCCIIFE